MRLVLSSTLIILASIAYGATFETVNFGGVQARSAVFDAEQQVGLLCLHESGFWKTTDGGENWIPINSRISSSSTYSRSSIVAFDSDIQRCVIQAQANFPAQGSVVTWYTEDQGETWHRNYENLHDSFYAFDKENPVYRYRCVTDVVQRSIDAGESWETIEMEYQGLGPNWLHQDIAHPEILYLLGYSLSYDDGMVYRSMDRGESWDIFLTPEGIGLDEGWRIKSFFAMSPDTLFVGFKSYNDNQLCFARSFNSGETWELSGSDLPISSLLHTVLNQNGVLYTTGTASGLYSSHDLGTSWSVVENGLPQANVYVPGLNLNLESQTVYASLLGRGVYSLAAGASQWSAVPMPDVGAAQNVSTSLEVHQGGISLLTYGGQSFRSGSDGLEFTEILHPFENELYQYWLPYIIDKGDFQLSHHRILTYSDNSAEAFLVLSNNDEPSLMRRLPWVDNRYKYLKVNADTTGGPVNLLALAPGYYQTPYWTSSDTGQTWEEHVMPWADAILENNVAGEKVAVVSHSNELFVSNDFGVSWENPPLGFPSLGSTENEPRWMGDTLLVSVESQVWAMFPDGTWESRGELSHNFVFDWEVIHRERGFILVEVSDVDRNPYVSFDGGWTWESGLLELPGEEYGRYAYEVKYDPFRDRLWAGTSCGLVYLDLEDLGVDEESHSFNPVQFDLLDVHPNPFNSKTLISCHLPVKGEMNVSVYDILGREVVQIFDGVQSKGTHRFTLDGDFMSSGVYIVQMHTDHGNEQQRVTLIR
ncbi:T9SS type A sorting domain-containing protein [bacterium]|nr:T9SS type A sorting domain-containing protein [bacterium]